MTDKKMKKGFTLIEIVIVLAIAALIMVVVFLAVQGAQRGQRDQFRKDTANRMLAATQQYRGNHSGSAPTAAANLATYMGLNSSDQVIANGVTVTASVSATVPTGRCSNASTGTATLVVASGANPDTVYACLENDATQYQSKS